MKKLEGLAADEHVEKAPLRIHATNTNGLGSSIIVRNILQSFTKSNRYYIERVYISEMFDLNDSYLKSNARIYKRRIPVFISRFIECVTKNSLFDGSSPILIMGDLPIRTREKQIVFLQQAFILNGITGESIAFVFKFLIMRIIFYLNLKFVDQVIVQTEHMKRSLETKYPTLNGRIHVIMHPPPFFGSTGPKARLGRLGDLSDNLALFYPSSYYGYKNHCLLESIDDSFDWPVKKIYLTIDEAQLYVGKPWVECLGKVQHDKVMMLYREVDCMLFLSKNESYGLPLVEAIFSGLPIICPDLPYARELCGDQAIYFKSDSPDSLKKAILILHKKISVGWWPDWSSQKNRFIASWEQVADRFGEIAYN